MNNEQFRKLMLANASSGAKSSDNGAAPARPAAGGALGSRMKSSIPMTPRSVAGAGRPDFARQMAERNQEGQKQKKHRTSAPRGSKLADGYVDRAKDRNDEDTDDRAVRLKALEESLKNEEIDQATFERLRFEIAGGDLSSTHLVKGLDFKLLERIRKGEDVYKEGGSSAEIAEPADEPDDDLDDALEQLEDHDVQAVQKEKAKKKGQYSTVLVPGQKRTRDQILAEMKAARAAAKAKEESSLGSRFKKFSTPKAAGSRIERDHKGREVLIIVDEDGHERRKVRKVAAEESVEREAFVPDAKAEVLGMEVPEFYQKKLEREAEEEAAKEVNIFDDADSDYDPLAGLDSGEDSAASDDENDGPDKKRQKSPGSEDGEVSEDPATKAMPPPPKPAAMAMPPPSKPQAKRNYFADSKSSLASEEVSRSAPSLSDPAVLAALRKAKTLNAAAKSEEEQENAAREERLKKLLENSNRDDDDMDMSFGSNRIADDADRDEGEVKLSKWGDDDDGDDGQGGKSKRKRGPKKRKGDGNNAGDVLRVLERRKEAEAKR